MKSNPLKSHQTAIITAAISSLALMFVPFLHWALLPMVYLNTHIHELCHALTAVGTGGVVDNIVVNSDGSGVTLTGGGIRFLVSSAGYVGSAIVGALLMMGSRTEKSTRISLTVLGVCLASSMLIWVRGDAVGIGAGFVWLAALFGLVRYGKGPKLMFAGQFIGVQQCLQSGLALNELIKISALTQGDSDAQNMATATGIPAIAWAVAWCGFSLFMVWLGLRKAWSPAPRTSRPAA